jgi:hypothetical protein
MYADSYKIWKQTKSMLGFKFNTSITDHVIVNLIMVLLSFVKHQFDVNISWRFLLQRCQIVH